MRTRLHLIALSALISAIGMPQSSVAQERDAKAEERIGIYDSRSVAIAYVGSPAHEKQLRQLKADHKAAKDSGDVATATRLEAEGKAGQFKMHQQGFSTASVDDILAHITNALPQIQKAAGVTTLVSKWDEAALKKHPRAEKVDVTMKLVDAFQPTERQRKSALEIQKRKPVPLERIKD